MRINSIWMRMFGKCNELHVTLKGGPENWGMRGDPENCWVSGRDFLSVSGCILCVLQSMLCMDSVLGYKWVPKLPGTEAKDKPLIVHPWVDNQLPRGRLIIAAPHPVTDRDLSLQEWLCTLGNGFGFPALRSAIITTKGMLYSHSTLLLTKEMVV